ncbi:MAG TPA: hypothetical protein VGL94_05450 [Ktedonobacteraceae bacterium]
MPLVSLDQEILPGQAVLRLQQPVAAGGLSSISRVPLSGISNAGLGMRSEMVIAGLHGRVMQFTRRGGVVIESRVALVRGSFGIGKQIAGVLTLWQSGPTRTWQTIPSGAILVVPGPLSFALLHQAVVSGVAGIVASSIALRDLEQFLRTDLIALFASDNVERALAYLPPITLLLTEGLGATIMPTPIMNLFSHYQDSIALLDGQTSVRRRIFPELLISLPLGERQQPDLEAMQPQDMALAPGTLVRIRDSEKAGAIGIIDYLFAYEQKFRSGIHVRAARLRLEDGSLFTVPLTSIERIS